jgi:putative ABC transport system ATP-binding protein
MHLMQDLNRQGITVVVITHENEVAEYASRQIHFRDGRIESDSAHPDLKRASGGAA